MCLLGKTFNTGYHSETFHDCHSALLATLLYVTEAITFDHVEKIDRVAIQTHYDHNAQKECRHAEYSIMVDCDALTST